MNGGGVSLSGEGLLRRRGKGEFELNVPHVEAPAGRTLALLGPSGSGKTTLLEILGLLERPDEGQVLFDGRPVNKSDRDVRLQMAAVFQRPYLFKGSIYGNVEYGLAAHGVPRRERHRRVCKALERVGLGGYEERSALALSGGEAQRVSLARALVLEPRVLLFDEPLASLDRLLRRRLIKDFATILSESAVTVVYVTHDQDEAFVVADRIAIMNSGRIVECGSTDNVAGLASDEWTADFLGVEPALKGSVVSASEGLFQVSIGGIVIAVSGEAAVGQEVLVAVRPEDVLLFERDAEVPVTSARNKIEGTLVELESEGPTIRATFRVDSVALAASVSRAAAADLDLHVGMPVLAVFKASGVRWLPASATDSPSGSRANGRPERLPNDDRARCDSGPSGRERPAGP